MKKINELNKTFNFGKIAYGNPKRKANAVEVQITLTNYGSGYYEFTAMGSIWNSTHTDVLSGGQNLDEIAKYLKGDELFDELFTLWSKYHLNGMNAGTRKQEEALNSHFGSSRTSYDERCEYLKSIGLYTDDLGDDEVINGSSDVRKGYAYGTGWVFRTLPVPVLNRIKELISRKD